MVSIYFFNNKTLFLHTKSIPCIKRPLNKRRKKTTASKFRHIMSAVGTTLLQSPGWNEDKARYVTLGIHREKKMSSVGAALTERVLVLHCGCAAPLGLNKCVSMINPGLAPWAMQEYRPYRAPLRPTNQYTLLFRCGCPEDTKKDCAKIHFDTVPYN